MKRTTQTKLSKRPSISTVTGQPKRKYTRKVVIAVLSKETAPPLDVSPAVEQKVIVRQSTLESIHARLSSIDDSLQKMAFSMLALEHKRSEPEDFPQEPEQMELPLDTAQDHVTEPNYPTVEDVRAACQGLDRDYLVAMLNSFGANRISDITPGERQAFIDNVTKEN
jgi:hypothetical protein